MKRSREELIKSDLKSGICHNYGSCADSSFGTRSVDATSADKENDPGAAQVKRNEEESNECSNDNGEDSVCDSQVSNYTYPATTQESQVDQSESHKFSQVSYVSIKLNEPSILELLDIEERYNIASQQEYYNVLSQQNRIHEEEVVRT